MKTCTRQRAGRLDSAPLVNGDRHLVECLIAAANGYQLTFGAPTIRAMNGEIKLVNGDLGLYTQDGVDKVLNTPIINDGSNGKLVVLITNIEEQLKLNPMLHGRSSRTDKEKFMAAKHVTLNGKNTSNQSTGLENMIHRMQMPIYDKGLGKLTPKQRSVNGKLGNENGVALFTYEQRRAIWKKSLALTKFYCPPPTITKSGMHDLAKDDVVFQANYGTGTVKGILRPSSDKHARARVKFDDEQVGTRPVTINSLSCNGKQCQFVKEYKLTPPWPKTEAEASVREFDWGKCSKCGTMGSYNDPENPGKRHQHSRKCTGYFGRQT